jgi:hypothetical protein
MEALAQSGGNRVHLPARVTSRDVCRHTVIVGFEGFRCRCYRRSYNAEVDREWSPVNGSMLKRRDFTFHGLLAHEHMKELPLFSDLGENAFIPTPEKEYPPRPFHGDRSCRPLSTIPMSSRA